MGRFATPTLRGQTTGGLESALEFQHVLEGYRDNPGWGQFTPANYDSVLEGYNYGWGSGSVAFDPMAPYDIPRGVPGWVEEGGAGTGRWVRDYSGTGSGEDFSGGVGGSSFTPGGIASIQAELDRIGVREDVSGAVINELDARVANFGEIRRALAEAAAARAGGGGAVAAIDKAIADTQLKWDQDVATLEGLRERLKGLWDAAAEQARDTASAEAALAAVFGEAREDVEGIYAGARGKIRAMADLVGSENPEGSTQVLDRMATLEELAIRSIDLDDEAWQDIIRLGGEVAAAAAEAEYAGQAGETGQEQYRREKAYRAAIEQLMERRRAAAAAAAAARRRAYDEMMLLTAGGIPVSEEEHVSAAVDVYLEGLDVSPEVREQLGAELYGMWYTGQNTRGTLQGFRDQRAQIIAEGVLNSDQERTLASLESSINFYAQYEDFLDVGDSVVGAAVDSWATNTSAPSSLLGAGQYFQNIALQSFATPAEARNFAFDMFTDLPGVMPPARPALDVESLLSGLGDYGRLSFGGVQ